MARRRSADTDRSMREYRRRRDPARTPEPMPTATPASGHDDTFVIQQHDATSLHWDLRLERAGVLVSWAVPRGLPTEPGVNRLAVHTEDHPLEYSTFEGTIPAGEYGGGTMTVWDAGTYQTEEWRADKVTVTLAGSRVRGRYALFATDGRNWLIRRLDPPQDPDRVPMPDTVEPMQPVRQANPPRDRDRYSYEFDWGGERAIAFVSGGRIRLHAADGSEIRAPAGLPRAARRMGARPAVLDGELVTLAADPVFVGFDLLYDDGVDLTGWPQQQRWDRLDALPWWGGSCQLAPRFDDPAAVRATARERGLPGIVAKRRDAPYRPGTTSAAWKRIPA